MLYKSIRFRIQAWHSLLLVATTIALSITYYSYQKQEQIRAIDARLQSYAPRVLRAVERVLSRNYPEEFGRNSPRQNRAEGTPGSRLPPLRNRPPNPPGGGEGERRKPTEILEFHLENVDAVLWAWGPQGNLLHSSEFATGSPPDFPENPPKLPDALTLNTPSARVHIVPTGSGAFFALKYDTSKEREILSILKWKLLFIDLGIITLGITGGWFLTGRALTPISTISQTAQSISNGDRSNRINTKDTDSELGQLAQILNDTFEKLERSYEQQVKFTADASHELRTPVAVLLSQIQLALSKNREISEYKAYFEICQVQANHMRDLLNSLLDLARSDSGELEFKPEKCELIDVINESIEWLESLAAKHEVTVKVSLAPITAYIDGLRMSQVFVNIISNAIHHSPPGSEVIVESSIVGSKASIRISDKGPGIPPEVLPHIFERFYRASKARSPAEGSVGLGLAIAKSIVDSHKGTVRVESSPQGTTFTIELPVATID